MKPLTLPTGILLVLISFLPGFSQRYEHPLRFYADPKIGPIRLLGGDPEFIVRCVESDFGVGLSNYYEEIHSENADPDHVTSFTKVTWPGTLKPAWSKSKFTFTISYSYNHPSDYASMSYDSIGYMVIECMDVIGKDLTNDSSIRKAIIQYISDKFFKGFAFVNSANGINVRQAPSLTSSIIYRLKDQQKVILQKETDEWAEITRSDSTTVRTRWVKIYVDATHSGYVLQTFLLPWYSLHPKQIYDVWNVSVAHSGTEEQHYSAEPYLYDESESRRNPDYQPGCRDTISKYVDIRLVCCEDNSSRMKNQYVLDTTKIGTLTKPTSGYVADIRHSIKLPINGGKDSIHIQDQPGEYPVSVAYVGRVPAFNLYVFRTFSFGEYYDFYDIKTGAPSYHFKGIPVISPDGQHAVDVFHDSDPELVDAPHTCWLTISKIGAGAKVQRKLSAQFYAWLPDDRPNRIFWISDSEFIIPITSAGSSLSPEGSFYECLKLTIK